MKLLTDFCTWFKRTFFPTDFDAGYDWAEQELRHGTAPDTLLVGTNSTMYGDFLRGAREAVRSHKEQKHVDLA
jgi:hypothetical protein